MKLFVTIILLFQLRTSLVACNCADLKPLKRQEFKKAGLVFIGKVLRIDYNEQENKKNITFEVKEWLKGNERTSKVIISTASYSASCGLSITEGESWYIFVDQEDNNSFYVGRCGRSVQLDRKFDLSDKHVSIEKRKWKKRIKRYKQDKILISIF